MVFSIKDPVYSVYVIQKYIRVCLLYVTLGHVMVFNIRRNMAIQNWDNFGPEDVIKDAINTNLYKCSRRTVIDDDILIFTIAVNLLCQAKLKLCSIF